MIGRSATFSDDRMYRYTLTRTWDDRLPPLVIIGLNPSTADETSDDPTIRRCIGFARREGMGSLVMLNLFAFRCADPRKMKTAPHPVAPKHDPHANDAALVHAIVGKPGWHPLVVAAWGVHGGFRQRDAIVRRLIADRSAMLRSSALHCFGITKEGYPKHPLYLPRDTQIVEFAA